MRKITLIASIISLLMISVPLVFAGTGNLRISPEWPTENGNPADFSIWVEGGDGTSNDVNILLILTEACYNNISDGIAFTITGDDALSVTLSKPTDFIEVTIAGGTTIPTSGTTPGACYQSESVKDHFNDMLDESLETGDKLYYAMAPMI